MRIIAFEGLDKSGKHTQTNHLVKNLENCGYKVMKSEFHRYDTVTGQLIKKWLYKEWDVDQLTIELIIAADKQAQQRWFEQLEDEGYDFLILDRYIASQQCYALASGVDADFVVNLQRYMRKPDLEIFSDIFPEENLRRKGKHGDNDRYESDLSLLRNVRERYKEYFSNRENVIILKDCDSLGVNDLVDKVFAEVKMFFGL